MQLTDLLKVLAICTLFSCAEPPVYNGGTKREPQKSPKQPADENVAAAQSASAKAEGAGATQPPAEPEAASSSLSPSCDNPSTVKADMVQVLIPKNDPQNGGMRCPFGKADNNDTNNAGGEYSARIERSFPINIPAGRVVCGMTASGQQQTIRYDDHLFLTLNNNVLMSSRGIPTAKFMKAANGFYQYNWASIRGTKSESPQKCAEGTTCTIPKTQERGSFSFAIGPDANKRLFGSLEGQPLYFSMILTGDDNEPIDCAQDLDITLNVDYTYIQK